MAPLPPPHRALGTAKIAGRFGKQAWTRTLQLKNVTEAPLLGGREGGCSTALKASVPQLVGRCSSRGRP